jgi:signal peptidase I
MAAARKRGSGTSSRKESGSDRNPIVEIVGIVAVALLLAFLIQLLLVKTYRIPSESMEPTLDIGQRVLVNRIGTHFGDPSVGDIIVFHPPKGADSQPGIPATCANANEGYGSSRACSASTPDRSSQTFIKRVVGVGGDRISIRAGHVIRNGTREPDAYIRGCGPEAQCDFPSTITVPNGSFYMMGDNRGNSDDSRFWGPVPKKWVIGQAFATYWPPKRIGLL